MNKQFNRMQKLAGILTEGLYTTQMDFESPVATEGGESYEEAMDNVEGPMPEARKMTKDEFKSKIREMILAEKSLSEAKKKKDKEEDTAEEDVNVDMEPTGEEDVDMTMDVPQPGDTSIDINGDGVTDIDAGSSEAKKAFGDLTDAFQAAKALGDEKLIRQIANTITYFNKNIILKQG
jgi:hypothetical protein